MTDYKTEFSGINHIIDMLVNGHNRAITTDEKDRFAMAIDYANQMQQHTVNPRVNDKPLLGLDFDGVLHMYDSKWKGSAHIPDGVVEGAMSFIEKHHEKYQIVIFSARCNYPDGKEAMKAWLLDNGLTHQAYRSLVFVPGKPPFHLLVDDRAMQFTGSFADIDPDAFHPWNRSGPHFEKT